MDDHGTTPSNDAERQGRPYSRDPAAQLPDDCDTKEGVLDPVTLLRRHQKKCCRAGPRGRPELFTFVLVQRSQTVLISFVVDDTHDILLLRLDGPDATGKGDLLGRDPAATEVGRGNGDALVQSRGSTTQGLDPVIPRPPEDLRHRTGEGGQVGRQARFPTVPGARPPFFSGCVARSQCPRQVAKPSKQQRHGRLLVPASPACT